MPEMAHASEHHREIMFIGSRNHFFIADRTARLNDSGGTGFGSGVQSISKREERITRYREMSF